MTPDEPAPPADDPPAPRQKLTDREPLADIQARLRRETDERLRGDPKRRRRV